MWKRLEREKRGTKIKSFVRFGKLMKAIGEEEGGRRGGGGGNINLHQSIVNSLLASELRLCRQVLNLQDHKKVLGFLALAVFNLHIEPVAGTKERKG